MRRYELEINGKPFSIAVHSFSTKRAELEVDGTRFTVEVKDVVSDEALDRPVRTSTARPVPAGPGTAPARPASPGRGTGLGSSASPGAGSVTAPIPGQILAILVAEGDTVAVGQALIKIEAMKMENMIVAHLAGTVAVIGVNPGDAVTQGQELLVIG